VASNSPEKIMTAFKHFVPALGRLLIAIVFLLSGVGKITAPAATQTYIASVGLPMPVLAYYAADTRHGS
jgi:putative oxidoreductase